MTKNSQTSFAPVRVLPSVRLERATELTSPPNIRRFQGSPMKQRSAAQKLTVQAGAMLHAIKIWLTAPVVFRRPAGLGNARNVHRTGSMPGQRDAVALLH